MRRNFEFYDFAPHLPKPLGSASTTHRVAADRSSLASSRLDLKASRIGRIDLAESDCGPDQRVRRELFLCASPMA